MYKVVDITKESSLYKDLLKYDGKFPSDFYKEINCPALLEIEQEMQKDCISQPSNYEKCTKIKRDGLNLCVFKKNDYLYKGMLGFVTKQVEDSYMKDKHNDLFWFGSIHVAYHFAIDKWGGINVFLVKDDLTLFDYFNSDNLVIFLKYVEKKFGKDSQEYQNIIAFTGYDITEKEQFNRLCKLGNWKEIWRFGEQFNEPYGARYCNTQDTGSKKLNPITKILGLYRTDKKLLKTVINDFCKEYKLDGFIRKQVRSTVELYGFSKEETILLGSSVISKLFLDEKHPYCWKQWKLPFTIPKDGFVISADLVSKNKNFQMVKFYLKNICKPIQLQPTSDISLLTYNVHGWKSINDKINIRQNFYNILDFIRKVNCKFVVLQEVGIKYSIQQLIAKMKSLGYIDYLQAPNGSKIGKRIDSYIMLFSKVNLQIKKVRDLSVDTFYRNCLEFEYNNIKFIGVHFEIGDREHYYKPGTETRIKIEHQNANLRLKQFKMITNNDVLFGDFNFGIDTEESKVIRKEYNYGLVDDRIPTNPFGTRTDMVFINKKSNIVATKSYTIKCNYSDHLPVVTYIKKIENK